jgi:hypothetical protein
MLVAGLVSLASAASLLPTKASQLVNVLPGAACPVTGHPTALALDTQVAPDGTTTSFTIPAKQVFVITSVNWTIGALTTGRIAFGTLLLVTSSTSVIPLLQAGSPSPADTAGFAAVASTIANGLVVRPGKTLCLDQNGPGGVGFGNVSGFFAADK